MNRTTMAMVGLVGGVGLFFTLHTATSTAAPVGPLPSTELTPQELQERVLMGRSLVLHHGCGDCHGGIANPAAPDWLMGMTDPALQEFVIADFQTRPRNLTPHNETGIGRFTERQIFNAIRFGLRPGETPDVEITSTTPGEGNFPVVPKYLAPPMPWPAFRHMADEEIMAIAAYLKHGVMPKENLVPDSEGPPDFWAGMYADTPMGSYPAPAFPAAGERAPGGM